MQELGRADAQLHHFLRISRHLAGQLDVQSALQAVHEEIKEFLEHDHLDVCLIDGADAFHTSYEVGLGTLWGTQRSMVAVSPVRDILTGRTEAMLSENALKDQRYTYPGAFCQPIFEHNLCSRINVAMKVRGEIIGALNFSAQREAAYGAAELDYVRHVADTLSPYFYALRAGERARRAAAVEAGARAREEGLRLGALQLTEALERERQRIGMDLHDQTLADLTRILRDLEQARPDSLAASVVPRLQDCIQDLRQIIDTAMPALLELFGFVHAVDIHLERATAGLPGVSTEVTDSSAHAPDRLERTVRIALFRIVQEAVNNAARHSGAARVEVAIGRAASGALSVEVRDDGTGLPATGSGRSGGLTHMQTRASLISARLEVGPCAGRPGTCVRVTLPQEMAR
ncbi:sensor histidine kinase [Oceanicella sp. SM1341]|uniref:sensor histidine kinase n=1 Tax=Oceanicella sp. SM1341 TaxID=1548889 RepID=UPI000E46D4DF|nr:ATP-binding protein [Oceanicella sp. SM1341]